MILDERLPTITIGNVVLTRLIAGWNPIGGHSHAVPALSKHMLEYFTADRVNEFLADCEIAGINAWQCTYSDRAVAACDYLMRRNSAMKVITVLSDLQQTPSLPRVIKETGCFALVYHGNRTDYLFRAKQQEKVKDFVKLVHDLGVQAGVATHCPEHLKQMAGEGWETDFYLCSLYDVSRPDYDQKKSVGNVVLGEPYFVSDPEAMTSAITDTRKPCLAFKVLGSGRSCYSPESVDDAFQYTFSRIKETDAVIVGMYPKFSDEVRENVRLTLKYGRTG